VRIGSGEHVASLALRSRQGAWWNHRRISGRERRHLAVEVEVEVENKRERLRRPHERRRDSLDWHRVVEEPAAEIAAATVVSGPEAAVIAPAPARVDHAIKERTIEPLSDRPVSDPGDRGRANPA